MLPSNDSSRLAGDILPQALWPLDNFFLAFAAAHNVAENVTFWLEVDGSRLPQQFYLVF